MDEAVLTTGADELYELVRKHNKISIDDAAKQLHMNVEVVNALVEFLVEERVFGIEYKFTTPYVYLSKEIEHHQQVKERILSKKEFVQQSQRMNIPPEKIEQLWKTYLADALEKLKQQFYQKAIQRNVPADKVATLWEKFAERIQTHGH